MARFLVYTTFAEGELERELKKLSSKSRDNSDVPIQKNCRLQSKQYECAVVYPDGSNGICHYTRIGPKCHNLRYERGEPNQHGHREYIARLYYMEVLERNISSVEGIAQEKAAEAFRQAIDQERKDAMRATPPGHGRQADSALYTLSLQRATQLAGRYALCTRLEPSGKLLAVSSTFATIEEANAARLENANQALLVGICCRWARRWMPLQLNFATA